MEYSQADSLNFKGGRGSKSGQIWEILCAYSLIIQIALRADSAPLMADSIKGYYVIMRRTVILAYHDHYEILTRMPVLLFDKYENCFV